MGWLPEGLHQRHSWLKYSGLHVSGLVNINIYSDVSLWPDDESLQINFPVSTLRNTAK